MMNASFDIGGDDDDFLGGDSFIPKASSRFSEGAGGGAGAGPGGGDPSGAGTHGDASRDVFGAADARDGESPKPHGKKKGAQDRGGGGGGGGGGADDGADGAGVMFTYAEVNTLVRQCASDNLRERFSALVALGPPARSKEWQSVVGNRLGRKGIATVFRDLSNPDRGIRVAAAKLICDLAYGNAENQQLISFHAGFTVGHIRVFSSPVNLRQIFGSRRIVDNSDLQSALEDFVTQFPATKNRKFWCYPPYRPNVSNLFPDPNAFLVGFYLFDDPVSIPLFRVPTRAEALAAKEAQTAEEQRWRGRHDMNGTFNSTNGNNHDPFMSTASSAPPQSALSTYSNSPDHLHHRGKGTPAMRRTIGAGADDVEALSSKKKKGKKGGKKKKGLGGASGGKSSLDRPATASARLRSTPKRGSAAASSSSAYSPMHQRSGSKSTGARSLTGSNRPSSSYAGSTHSGPAAPGYGRPKSAPSYRTSKRWKDNNHAQKLNSTARSAMSRTFWDSIESATHLSSSNINSSATLNLQLHPAVATYKWNSAIAQRRILSFRSESADANGQFSATNTEPPALSRPSSAIPPRPGSSARRRPRTAGRSRLGAGGGAAGGAGGYASASGAAGPVGSSGASVAVAGGGGERKQFAVDVYSSPFKSMGPNIQVAPADPATTMLDFQDMLVNSEKQPGEAKGTRIKRTDTLVGLPTAGAMVSSGSLTLDKMAVNDMRRAKRNEKASKVAAARASSGASHDAAAAPQATSS